MWRCRGRIQNANVPYSTKHPALLHKDHHFTKLLFRKAHVRILHSGVKDTLAELRTNFWIVKGRSLVKSFIHQCSLPTFRGSPLFIHQSGLRWAPLRQRQWNDRISLYTCCVMCAVHLDLVPDMSTQSLPAEFSSFRREKRPPSKDALR